MMVIAQDLQDGDLHWCINHERGKVNFPHSSEMRHWWHTPRNDHHLQGKANSCTRTVRQALWSDGPASLCFHAASSDSTAATVKDKNLLPPLVSVQVHQGCFLSVLVLPPRGLEHLRKLQGSGFLLSFTLTAYPRTSCSTRYITVIVSVPRKWT